MRDICDRMNYCMERAEKGEELTIAFLGGSITQGSLATEPEKTYAYQVFEWWCRQFPNAVFHYVNGGIGGTSSHFGVARAVEDVLIYQPDVVFIDFSVNDDPESFFQETYEGVLRKIIKWKSVPAIMILNNVYYDTGVNAQLRHNALADYYQIPYVSMKDTIYKRMKNGEFTREDISPDGLHPNDRGHQMVADELIKKLEEIRKAKKRLGQCAENKKMLKPMTDNAYENAVRLNICNCQPELEGFRADTEEKKGHLDFFKNGWIGKKKGDKLTVEIECSCLAVQYRKSIHQPTPVAKLTIDGNQEQSWVLDGNFEETWGDCLYLQRILHHDTYRKHKVEIEIIEAKEEDQAPFYLLSFIAC